jgi:hypothetical protein
MEFPHTNGSVADGTVALGRDLGEETVLETNRSKLDLSIIVVSFNTREMTLERLRSVVQESRGSTFEVLFIDNGSTDGSTEGSTDGSFKSVHLNRFRVNSGAILVSTSLNQKRTSVSQGRTTAWSIRLVASTSSF